MMYGRLRDPVLRLLKVDPGPPEPPAGSHASVEVFRASPRFLSYRLLGVWIAAGVVLLLGSLVAVGALVGDAPLGAVAAALMAVLILGILSLVHAAVRIDYEVRHYVFTDRSMRVREGAWQVREMTLSFANVQNLRVTQGPLQRLFGISDLKVETAGGGAVAGAHGAAGAGGHSVTVAGVRNAADLRELVGARVRRYTDAGLGDPDDGGRPPGPPSGEGRRLGPPRAVAGPSPDSPGVREALTEVREAARGLREVAEGVARDR